jgi:hypothetical protein
MIGQIGKKGDAVSLPFLPSIDLLLLSCFSCRRLYSHKTMNFFLYSRVTLGTRASKAQSARPEIW